MPHSCLYVTFDNPKAVYWPGSVVTGYANLDLTEPLRAKSLVIAAYGCTKVGWTERYSRTENGEKKYDNVYFTDSEVHFDGARTVWKANAKERVLPVGTRRFPFSLVLPSNCPPSFVGEFGYIRYHVEMKLDPPWEFNRTQEHFRVIPDPYASSAMEPLTTKKVDRLGMIFFGRGDVTVEYSLEKNSYFPGETIKLHIKVVNDSSVVIEAVTVKLLGEMQYTVREGTARSQFDVGENNRLRKGLLNKEKEEFMVLANSERDIEVSLKIPNFLDIPSINTCPLIYIQYRLKVKLKTKGVLYSNIGESIIIKIRLPIDEKVDSVAEAVSDHQEDKSTSNPPDIQYQEQSTEKRDVVEENSDDAASTGNNAAAAADRATNLENELDKGTSSSNDAEGIASYVATNSDDEVDIVNHDAAATTEIAHNEFEKEVDKIPLHEPHDSDK